MDMLLLCCLLAKPGRYVSIAAICIDRKGNNKTRRYPPIMPPCPVKRRTLLSLPKNGKRRFFKTAVRYVHWAYLTTRRNNGFFYNRSNGGYAVLLFYFCQLRAKLARSDWFTSPLETNANEDNALYYSEVFFPKK